MNSIIFGDAIRDLERQTEERRQRFAAIRAERIRRERVARSRFRLLLICIAVLIGIGAAAVVYVDAVMSGQMILVR